MATAVPPLEAVYHSGVPVPEDAPNVNVPASQRDAGVVPVIVGLLVTVTEVFAVLVQPLLPVTVIVYDPDIADVALADTVGL